MRILQHLTWLTYLALCLFVSAVVARRDVESRTLVLERGALRAAQAGDEVLRGRPLTPAEQRAFEADWIRNRVLLHEARLRGLDRGDPLIRASVLGRTILSLAPVVGTPTAEDLRRHFDDNHSAYEQPATLRISLATFPAGAEPPPEASVRARLEAGERPEELGPSSRVGPRLEGVSIGDLRVLFGSAFAERVFDASGGRWIGPIASTFGTHFVRIDERLPPRRQPFDEVEGLVRQDWVAAQEERIIAPTLEKLRKRSTVTGLGR